MILSIEQRYIPLKWSDWKFQKIPLLELPQVRVQCVQASSRTHYFDEMVKDLINVNNEGCHFRLFSERVNEWKQKREVGALKNVLLELGFRSDGGNLQHRILWLLPTNWQLKHESKSYFRNLQRGCTPAKLYLFVLWKIFNSQIREWSQSLQDAIFNSTWPSSSSPYTFSAITSTSFMLSIIFSAAEGALYPYTVKRRDILAPTFPTTKKFPEVGEFCIIDSLKINLSLVIWCDGFWSRMRARRFQD